ncbi:MAG: hypothetical protein ACR2KW_03665 [Rubrobacter sp.]
MDRNDERRQRLGRSESDSGRTGGSSTGSRDSQNSTDRTSTDRTGSGNDSEKGTIDKLIDKAQEKGFFEKAEKFVRDKFGGGGSGGSSRRR